jgi:hypothetical protein
MESLRLVDVRHGMSNGYPQSVHLPKYFANDSVSRKFSSSVKFCFLKENFVGVTSASSSDSDTLAGYPHFGPSRVLYDVKFFV